MEKKKILVTGGAGFIGSHVVCKMLRSGYTVNILDNFSTGRRINIPIHERVTTFEGDTRDPLVVSNAVRGCSVIVHLAAIVGVEEVIAQPLRTVEVETIGTYNIVQAAKKYGVKKIIYASSSAVYKTVETDGSRETDELGLVSNYAIAKRLNERYLSALIETDNISVNCLRFFNIYGERQDTRMVIPRFFNQAIHHQPIEVFGGGLQTRDFTSVLDVQEAIYRLSQRLDLNGTFNISRGQETTIADLAKMIKKITNSKSEILMLSNPDARKTFRVNRRIGNNDKLFRAIDFRPGIKLADGLSAWFEKEQETNLLAHGGYVV